MVYVHPQKCAAESALVVGDFETVRLVTQVHDCKHDLLIQCCITLGLLLGLEMLLPSLGL